MLNDFVLITTTMRVYSIILLLFFGKLLVSQPEKVEIITLYDDYQVNTQTRVDGGFACLIIHRNDTILFDTGNREDILFHNLKVLGIDIKSIHSIILSHHHGDHTGNVIKIVKMNPGIRVFLPTSLKGEYENRIKGSGGKPCVGSDCKRIVEDIYLSGEMGFQIKEQALVIDTKKGLVIISGCGHPGIDRMILQVRENFRKDVFLVMGGFHMQEATPDDASEMIERFKFLGVKKVAPSHCTGKLAMKMFREAYQSDFIRNGTGKIIEI
ncbi:MAG: hypothetical protein B6D64_13825 [Bacteroidetes bacterium 4484_276]|nr:MAG: hypothetical protein B6D64_13825 [Bacteroidetes bacterium 4484_276]OYT12876.1 MAG: MBL fold metallo-hydrolase [Bacteroidetes bacterium 4572_114]